MINFVPAIAELWLAITALILVIGGVFTKPEKWIGWVTVALIAIVFALYAATRHYGAPVSTFDGMFMQDALALTFKYIIGTGSFLALLLAVPYLRRRNEGRF